MQKDRGSGGVAGLTWGRTESGEQGNLKASAVEVAEDCVEMAEDCVEVAEDCWSGVRRLLGKIF